MLLLGASVINFEIFSVNRIGRGTTSVRHIKERVKMKALYIWEKDFLECLHESEAMERSTFKREKNFVQRE